MNKWLDITEELTPKAIVKLKAGQILVFQGPNGRADIKIMRNTGKKVWAKYTHLYTPEEMNTFLSKK